jgi:hypothetical protein
LPPFRIITRKLLVLETAGEFSSNHLETGCPGSDSVSIATIQFWLIPLKITDRNPINSIRKRR